MDDHPNATLFRKGYAAFGSGDMATVASLLADDVVWHAPGHNALAGDYTGIPAVLGLFGRTFELTGGTFRTEVHDIVANDVHGVALVTISGSRDGKTITASNAHVVHFHDGKLTESWQTSSDQAVIDELFA
jgi:ketosteroid isomerase-like protein